MGGEVSGCGKVGRIEIDLKYRQESVFTLSSFR